MRTLCLPVSDRETPASTANAASQADAVCISSGAHRCASRAVSPADTRFDGGDRRRLLCHKGM